MLRACIFIVVESTGEISESYKNIMLHKLTINNLHKEFLLSGEAHQGGEALARYTLGAS